MLLYCLPGSPFARTARVLLRELNLPHREVMIDAFPPADAFFDVNPMGQVPVLDDEGQRYFPTISVVRHIFRRSARISAPSSEMAPTLARDSHTEADEQILDVILAVADLIAATQYMKWADMVPGPRNRLGFATVERNGMRIARTLDWLDARIKDDGFWPGMISVQDIALAAILLWTDSRGPIPWRGRPGIEGVVAKLALRRSFLETEPPPLDDSWKS